MTKQFVSKIVQSTETGKQRKNFWYNHYEYIVWNGLKECTKEKNMNHKMDTLK